MHSTEAVRKSSHRRGHHLALAASSARPRAPFASSSEPPTNMATVRQLTHAMMNRLWIPHTHTIVGLLDVGLSHDNFDELSKWVARELTTASSAEAANELPRLERRFRRAVDRFPEL